MTSSTRNKQVLFLFFCFLFFFALPHSVSEAKSKIQKNQTQTQTKDIHSFVMTHYRVDQCGKNKDHPTYGITKSGKKAIVGLSIAVDPKVIPLGSWVKITLPNGETMIRRADDTGKKVKGKKIDLLVSTKESTIKLGVKNVKVQIITPKKNYYYSFSKKIWITNKVVNS